MNLICHKDMLCSESVKAKVNVAYGASLDRFSTEHGLRLRSFSITNFIKFYNQTQFIELFHMKDCVNKH